MWSFWDWLGVLSASAVFTMFFSVGLSMAFSLIPQWWRRRKYLKCEKCDLKAFWVRPYDAPFDDADPATRNFCDQCAELLGLRDPESD